MSSSATSVRRLALEHPGWLPVLEAAVAVAERVEDHGGEFAGAWVISELTSRGGPRWVPNLRLLVTHGLIEKSGESTRGGRRAYYRMTDRVGIEEALAEWRASAAPARRLRFIGAGEGNTRDGRRADEAPFEPRSWR